MLSSPYRMMHPNTSLAFGKPSSDIRPTMSRHLCHVPTGSVTASISRSIAPSCIAWKRHRRVSQWYCLEWKCSILGFKKLGSSLKSTPTRRSHMNAAVASRDVLRRYDVGLATLSLLLWVGSSRTFHAEASTISARMIVKAIHIGTFLPRPNPRALKPC